ncbi:MAG: hypothetical protein Q4F20_03195 [Eubacteriales bacterium]|nr:hypothetical protein [Eubacteriales bacterium]
MTALQAAGTRARRAEKRNPPAGRVSGLLSKGSNVLSRLENDAGDDLERKLNEEEKQRFNNKAPS